jgi:hypothetical protein
MKHVLVLAIVANAIAFASACAKATSPSSSELQNNDSGADTIALVQSADYEKFDTSFGATEALLARPGEAPVVNGLINQASAKVVISTQSHAALADLLRPMNLTGYVMSNGSVLLTANLNYILKATELTDVHGIRLAKASDEAGNQWVGAEPQNLSDFTSVTDSIATPVVKRALYNKLDAELRAEFEKVIAANLQAPFEGLVKFSENLTQVEASEIMPGLNVIAGTIGTFRGSLGQMLAATTSSKIVYFEAPRRVYPHPHMGIGN